MTSSSLFTQKLWVTPFGGGLVFGLGGIVTGGGTPPAGGPPASRTPTKIVIANGVVPPGYTANQVFTTPQLAINATVPGDWIQVRANSVGGTQTFSSTGSNLMDISRLVGLGIVPSTNVVMEIRSGDHIRFVSNKWTITGNGGFITVGSGTANVYFILDAHQAGSFKIGDSDQTYVWSNTSFACGATQQMGINFYGGIANIKFFGTGCNFANTPGFQSTTQIFGGQNYCANLLDGSTQDILFDGWEFYLHGNNHWFNPNQGAFLNGGDLFHIGTVNHIFANSSVNQGGHDSWVMNGPLGLNYNCQIGNDWTHLFANSLNTGYPQVPDPYPGCRCATVGTNIRSYSAGDTAGSSGGNSNLHFGPPYGPNLLYSLRWNDAGPAGGQGVTISHRKADSNETVDIGGYYMDVTTGYMLHMEYYNASQNASTAPSPQDCTSFNYFAHATGIKMGGFIRADDQLINPNSDAVYSTDFEGHTLGINCILYDIVGVNADNIENFIGWFLDFGASIPPYTSLNVGTYFTGTGQAARNYFKAGRIAEALIVMDSGATANADQIWLLEGPNNGTYKFDSGLPSNFTTNDIFGYPNIYNLYRSVTGSSPSANNIDFVSLGTNPHRQPSGLRLANTTTSVFAGNAVPLTTVTATATSTTISIHDPKWFAFTDVASRNNPFIPDYNNYQPYIYGGTSIGSATLLGKVISINRSAKTITLDRSASVTNGWGIWFGGADVSGGASPWFKRGAAQS